MDATTILLRVEHVAKRFGAVTALRDVNLRLGTRRGARPHRRQRRRQVDPHQDPLRLPPAGRRPHRRRRRGGRRCAASTTPARSASTPSTRTWRWSTSCRVYHNMFLNREHRALAAAAQPAHAPAGPRAPRRHGRQHPRRRPSRWRKLSGGQRQAIAVARSVYSDATDPAARRAAGRDGRQGGRADPRPHRATSRPAATSRSSSSPTTTPRSSRSATGSTCCSTARSPSTSRPPRPRSTELTELVVAEYRNRRMGRPVRNDLPT